MRVVIEISEDILDRVNNNYPDMFWTGHVKNAIKSGTLLPKDDKWAQLKETIVEIRDNNTYDHKDVSELCGFLLNYMSILEDNNEDND